MNNEDFLSIDKNANISFVVNKSEFIGHIFYVETVKEAENYILDINENIKRQLIIVIKLCNRQGKINSKIFR